MTKPHLETNFKYEKLSKGLTLSPELLNKEHN